MILLPKTSCNASHVMVQDEAVMQRIVKQGWEFMDAAYRWVPGGFLSFADEDDMVASSLVWVLVYDGPQPDPDDIDFNHVYCAVAYKSKFGLKAVAFGQQSTAAGKAVLTDSPRNRAAQAIDFKVRRAAAKKQMFTDIIKRGWAEVSERPEQIFLSLGAPMIPAQTLIDAGVFKDKKVHVEDDGFHYSREIGGKLCTKVAVGKGFRG